MKFLTLAFTLLMTMSIFSQTPPVEPGVAQTLARWRAAHYSDVRYKLNITLEKGAPTMKGTIEIRVKLNEQGGNPTVREGAKTPANLNAKGIFAPSLTRGLPHSDIGPQIILDWRKIRGKEDLSTVSNVSVNGKPAQFAPNPPADAGGTDLRFEEADEHLVFRDGVKTGENVIKLDFTSPIATSGAAVTRYVDKTDGAEYVYSLFVPSDASTAFPVFDQPDLKARFSLTVKADWHWKIISNTKPRIVQKLTTSHTEDWKKQLTEIAFEETKPISTYVFAFAAGDFAEVSEPSAVADGLTRLAENSNKKSNASNAKLQPPATADGSDLLTKIYVRKSQVEKFKPHAAETFRLNREAVRFLESYFDYKFPFPKYDLVLIPEFPFGGMEHAGATFLRESSIIFPSEPTANDYISRANLIFHEAAHQWFGDTVTMRWFDDLWLKEGFAEFMAYKTLEKVLPEYNAWKAFYERNKPLAYLTDSTRGTTPIYQEIPNLSAAKSAYGNIVYRKAPSFLKQAEFYLGEDKFQTAVRAFLKKHQFANAEWTDLVKEFETASGQDLKDWANVWVKQRGLPIIRFNIKQGYTVSPTGIGATGRGIYPEITLKQQNVFNEQNFWQMKIKVFYQSTKETSIKDVVLSKAETSSPIFLEKMESEIGKTIYEPLPNFIFPNYQDYGYGIFLLDEKSRAYVLENIQNEKDAFLRSMMWGTLWDSVREAELDPKTYVELAIKNISVERDELTIQTILSRVATAMNYYIESVPPAVTGGLTQSAQNVAKNPNAATANLQPSATADGTDSSARLENLLIEKMRNAPTPGARITFYRAFLNVASSENARNILKRVLKGEFSDKGGNPTVREGAKTPPNSNIQEKSDAPLLTRGLPPLKTKDKFDIVTRLAILGDADAPKLLADLQKTETSDDAKRFAYAAQAGFGTAENKARFWKDFVGNKELSESWIEAAFVPFNAVRHSELTLPYLEKALAELPVLKRNRKIFFVNAWLGAFIGGQRDERALAIVNKFLADNPNLDRDLRLKILENVDGLERAVKIRAKF